MIIHHNLKKYLSLLVFMNTQSAPSYLSLLEVGLHELMQANQALADSAQHWPNCADDALDEVDLLGAVKLLLQYRMDSQSIFKQLLHIDQSLLQLLGIEPQNSLEFNLERMSFALGGDELQHLLSLLENLLDSLLQVINSNRARQIVDKKTALKRMKHQQHLDSLVEALNHQEHSVHALKQLGEALDEQGFTCDLGPIYDEIAALRGPISHFFQAVQHGLIVAGGLYQQMHQDMRLESYLGHVIHGPDMMAHSVPQEQRLFTPETHLTNERLEARAAHRRLGPFFNH